jgi:hypothetical protein
MNRWLQRLSLYFAAGSLGGLVNSVAAWLCGVYGVSAALQVALHPRLTPGWLYPRIVWGGLWGLLFMIPMVKSRFVLRGLIVSLGPTAVQLFYFFPHVLGKGLLGVKLGTLTPLLVLLLNAVWGVSAALWLRLVDRSA